MRDAELSSTSAVNPGTGAMLSSRSAVPVHVTVIDPPAEAYVSVNGASVGAGASVVEVDAAEPGVVGPGVVEGLVSR